MLTPRELRELVGLLLTKHGLADWGYVVHDRMQAAALCDPTCKVIRISGRLAHEWPAAMMFKAIKREIQRAKEVAA